MKLPKHFFLLGFLVLCSVGLLSCSSDLPDSRALPYKYELVKTYEPGTQIADLDGDGVDEVIQVGTLDISGGFIAIKRQDDSVIEQINYATPIDGHVHFLDYDEDGTLEILVPFLRNDSLFVSFVNARGEKLFHFFLIDGEPREEEGAFLPWDPWVLAFYVTDVDGDRRKELISVVETGYARLPRGVLLHQLPGGQPVGKAVIAGMPRYSLFDDFDGDGVMEVALGTLASDNGAEVDGLADRNSYIVVVEIGATQEVQWWREMGGMGSETYIAFADFDGNGNKEILAVAMEHGISPTGRARMELIEPAEGVPFKQRTFASPFKWPQVVDLNRDSRPEVIAVSSSEELWVFNHELEITHRWGTRVGYMQTLPDLTGNGVDEIIATIKGKGIFMLDAQLQPQARIPSSGKMSIMRGTEATSLLVSTVAGRNLRVWRLLPNRFHWFYRYGSYALWILGGCLILGVGVGLHRLQQRRWILRGIQALAFQNENSGLLVMTPQGRLAWMNAILHEHLGSTNMRTGQHNSLAHALGLPDEWTSFLEHLLQLDEPYRQEGTISIKVNSHEQVFQVVAEPMQVPFNASPYWLVTVLPEDQLESKEARSWALMAQRVAHDIKNPLTSILLTLQRLQLEYQEKAPEMAKHLDPYSTRIEDRIEHLRRMTRNFMKFVDLEEPDLTRTDLKTFIEEKAQALRRGLPHDIQLALKLDTGLPRVRVDQEQLQSVLENIIINAINAMSEGGIITLSLQMAQGLQFPGEEARNYIAIEIIDTGDGMSDSVQQRLFEPGFSTSKNGTGLGLAIVKKIIHGHEGHIEVESKLGEGSVFTVYVPVVK